MAIVFAYSETGLAAFSTIHNSALKFADVVAEALKDYDAGSIGDYDIVADEIGETGEYYIVWPSWLPAGTYTIQFTTKAGQDPAESDLPNRFSVSSWYWDGVNLVPDWAVKLARSASPVESSVEETVATNLDGKVSALPTATAITTAVWASGTRTLTSLGTVEADIATAVWAATRRTLTGAGGGIGPTAGISTADIYGQVFRGGTRPLCARVYLATGIDITQAAIDSITYSIYKLNRNDPDAREAVTGHVDVAVTIADVVFDTLQSDAIATSYNVKHVPDVSTQDAFSEAGAEYLVEYRVQPTEGQVIIVRHRLACV